MFAQVEPNTIAGSVDAAYQVMSGYLPQLIGALAILVVGWVGAVLVAALTRSILRRTGLDRRLANWFKTEGEEAKPVHVERTISRGVFWVLMLIVLVGFLETLGLRLIPEPLNDMLRQVFVYVPRIVGAAAVLAIAWILATGLRLVVRRFSAAAKVDEHVSEQVGIETQKRISLTDTLADTVYWLVFLLFLPAVLDALALPGLLAPVSDMVSRVLAFLPNILAAGLILVIGWFVARIVRRISTNLLAAVGTDRLSERVGLTSVMGENQLSGVLGLVVYILILLPVLVASLGALQVEAVTGPASAMLNSVLTALPAIFAAAAVLFVAYVVGRVVAELATQFLTGIGFDSLPTRLGMPGRRPEQMTEHDHTPSRIVGYLVLVATMLFATMQALPLLGFDMLAGLISQFLVFGGHILAGLVIFGLGMYLANLAARTVQASRIAQANLLAGISRVSILVLAGAMGLRQMGVANEIITSAFTLVLGAFAVAAALAFGLGGRETAGRMLDDFIQSRKPRAKTNSPPPREKIGAGR